MIRGSSLSLSSFSKLYGSSIFHSIILWRFLRCRLSTRFLWKTKSVGKFSTKHEKQVQIGRQKTITNTHLFWSKTLHFLLLFWYNKSTIKCLVLCHPFLQALYHFEPAEFRRLPHKYLPVQVIANTQIPPVFCQLSLENLIVSALLGRLLYLFHTCAWYQNERYMSI